jgi:hypothetical protein
MKYHTKDLGQRAEDIASGEEKKVWRETGDDKLRRQIWRETYLSALQEFNSS